MSDQGFQRVEEDAQLELSGGRLPTAQNIRTQLKTQLNNAVLAERARRGEVHVPEDTWAMQRSLAKVIEVTGEYERAFRDAAKEAKAIAEEELIDAVGEQDGVPLSGLLVPDPEGDVKIGLDTRNDYEIDQAALASAVAFQVMEEINPVQEILNAVHIWDLGWEYAEISKLGHDLEGMLADLLTLAMQRLVELGTFKPGVMKARAFIKELGRMPGADGVAGSVASSIRKTTQYRGVKVERVDPK
jgi:hypothetical protein